MNFAIVADILRSHPEIAVFLCLGVGYWVGGFKWGTLGLGTVVGTLVTGLVIGQLGFEIDPFVKTLFFTLFMFATGYKVGPQFFSGLRQGGVSMIACTVVFAVAGLFTALGMAKLMGLDMGFASGLISGGLTQSSVIGTATDAINALNLPADQKKILASHVPVADACTYLFGAAGVALLLSKVAPKLIGISLPEEVKKLEASLSETTDGNDSLMPHSDPVGSRAFRLTSAEYIGRTVRELEGAIGTRLYVANLRRNNVLESPKPDDLLREGDTVVITGHLHSLLGIGNFIGPEIFDPEALTVVTDTLAIYVTEKTAHRKTIGELSRTEAAKAARSVFIKRVLRQGSELPLRPTTRIERGDVIEIVGIAHELEAMASLVGVPERATEKTDFIFMGLAIAVGMLIGLISTTVGGITLSLGTSCGVLVAGLLAGWLHNVRPRLGRVPPPAVWIMETLGLNVFVAIVGLDVGAIAVNAIREQGLKLILAGIVVSTLPHLATLFFGRFVLRMNGALLLGVSAGAGTSTPGIVAVEEEAHSPLPILGYTVPYALGNVLLTACGPLVVALMHHA